MDFLETEGEKGKDFSPLPPGQSEASGGNYLLKIKVNVLLQHILTFVSPQMNSVSFSHQPYMSSVSMRKVLRFFQALSSLFSLCPSLALI